MKKRMILGVILLSGVFACAADTVTFETLLQEMADPQAQATWPEHEYKSLQASSYNRASVTPDDPRGWFANRDNGFDLGKEMVGDRTEAIMMQHEGPGVITRIWTPFFYKSFKNRVGQTVRIYLDGEAEPTITANLIELVSGTGDIKAPFSQFTCRAGDLYLPIPFEKGCKITIEDKAFYYIVNYRAYTDSSLTVETYRPEFLEKYASILKTLGHKIQNPQPGVSSAPAEFETKIAPGAEKNLNLPSGANAITQLTFSLEAEDLVQALRSTVVEASFDGETTIWCPLGDFFANVNSIRPYKMRDREVLEDGTMICRWVMPYQTSAQIKLHNLGAQPVSAKVSVCVQPKAWSADSMYFHANWWTGEPLPPRPVQDMNFIEIQGRGVHVGDNLIVLNPHWRWWGEGDEKIYVDEDLDRRFPSQYGTGTEDYYGWAGGCLPTRADEFSSPFLANVRVGGEKHPDKKELGTHGYNICTRARALDATPFKEQFRFDMEAFNMISSPEAFLQYALVTFWYGSPGATHNRPPLPEAARAPVPQAKDVAAFAEKNMGRSVGVHRIANAIEFEGINEYQKPATITPAVHKIKEQYAPSRFNNDTFFFLKGAKRGDEMTFILNEQYKNRSIVLYPVTSWDFGILDIYVNDQLVVASWDGYSAKPAAGNPIDLGEQAPDETLFRIKFKVTGQNPASKNSFFGMDCLTLREVKN
ncbi:glycoside hydrolase family 172 protein [Pontiella sulfatireligans]|uniref:DUF2961 domain-containing protein n=1 Tax=Pontiella sulfatireligans TaxID=2750658 RepID=A0A6C2UGP3_9BACT|nr:glycoside hydrolase family 172 protein [Pontiella sulfatireligans]VGO19089.1 hypothetical protein SCARR_01145 [Pontiella sulfatireligans]